MLVSDATIELGYNLTVDFISLENEKIVFTVYEHCRQYVPGFVALYVTGSLVYGEWQDKVSDIDIVIITEQSLPASSIHNLQVFIGALSGSFTYIDNSFVDLESLDNNQQHAVDKAIILSYAGVCMYGQPLQLDSYMPDIKDFSDKRVDRAIRLLKKYQRGDIIESFKSNPHLLTRSTAKAAMRILSSIILLYGIPLQLDPRLVARDIRIHIFDLTELAQKTLAYIEHSNDDFETAAELVLAAHVAYVGYCNRTPTVNMNRT